MEVRRVRNRPVAEQALRAAREDETLDDLDVMDVFERCLEKRAVPPEERPELMLSYREIVQSMLDADVPVVVYVYPRGAFAARRAQHANVCRLVRPLRGDDRRRSDQATGDHDKPDKPACHANGSHPGPLPARCTGLTTIPSRVAAARLDGMA